MGWFHDLFGWPHPLEAPAPTVASRETWHVGDLGECLVDRWGPPTPGDPRKGALVRVRRLHLHHGRCFLGFVGIRGHLYLADNFRRIIPNHSPAEAGFAAKIRNAAKAPQTLGRRR